MPLIWEISQEDVKKTLNFIEQNKSKIYARKRVKDNIDFPPPEINREVIWECMFDCLLSTRQKSGPNSPIAIFQNQKPYPLTYEICIQQSNVEDFIWNQIGTNPSIQYKNKIANFATHNLNWLETDGGWEKLDRWLLPLKEQRKTKPHLSHKSFEREIANNFNIYFKGIGPKQSRNYLQLLGLTRYEIPIDSRFVNWIIANKFPLYLDGVHIGSLERNVINTRLSTPFWYDSILDKLQELSDRCNILPVELDGCVFASFDEEWEVGKIPF